jgi:PAS domain S-box-containing protein
MPAFVGASYARPVTTPTRAKRARRSAAGPPQQPDSVDPSELPEGDAHTTVGPAVSTQRGGRRRTRDPDGGAGDVHELLIAAVDEAARLLEADGAMVYVIDPATGHLRFAHDAGIRSSRSRRWVRSIDLPVGTGMFGRAVESRSVVLTRDYMADTAFPHVEETDRVVRDIGIRSMVVAPLVSGDAVYGALGTFSSRNDAFSESDIRLVRALADHAAAAMANARLIEALDASRGELAERADVERSLREIAARISGATDLSAVLQLTVDEAARLMRAEGARIELIDPSVGLLRGAYAAGTLGSKEAFGPGADETETLDHGVAGQAVVTGRPFWTGDYISDRRFPHRIAVDRDIAAVGIRSVMAVPLFDETGPFGALLVSSHRPDAWTEDDAGLLGAIADQAAITIRTTRLIDALGRSQKALARRATAEQALRELAARITALREPTEILRDVVTQAGRLVDADGVILDLLDPATGNLHWAYDDGLSETFSAEERALLWISVGVGATGMAVAEGRVVLADGDLAAQFPPSPESTEFYARTGFQTMIAAPITGDSGPVGVIEVYSRSGGAFDETDASLVGALASQAAIAITNANLIDELARSREDLARTADSERTLREIAGRVSATHDQEEILQAVIDASVRLLGASGAMIDLIGDPDIADAWTSRDSTDSPAVHLGLLSAVGLTPDAGVSGRAMQTREVEWTGAYLEDERFAHTDERDAFVRASGIRSVIAAPLIHRDVVVGAITVYGDRADAFDAPDAALLEALADQAAVAIANARLIDELERSRAEIARRADSERTLREIAARVSAILEPDEVLQRIVDETTRLLESDGARIDLYDPDIDALRWSYAAGDAMSKVPEWALTGGLRPGQAVAGTAFAERRPARTDDYLDDDRFVHDDPAHAFVTDAGIRSVISVPLAGDAVASGVEALPLGTLSVVSRRVGAYDDADAEILTAFATQASIAIRNARLIDELARSRAVIERRAEAEQALREIAARITAIREPGDLLQRIVDEAFRLLRADGAVIDEYEPGAGVLISAYDAGLTEEQRASVRTSRLRIGEGLSGRAMAERRVIAAGDYLAGDFTHLDTIDDLARTTGIGDLIVAPIIGDEGPLGAIEVYRRDRHAFDEMDAAVLGGLADQAAIAITNAHLIRELQRSQAAEARRAETERALREITAGIAALREPEVILDRVVEEARRLLGTDGAHLTRMAEDGTYLVPMVVAGSTDGSATGWLMSMRFPLGGGINGLAAELGKPIWTSDYAADPRIPHEGDDDEVALRMGLCGMAAAPLRAPGGEVIGTLAISSQTPRDFDEEELGLLQGLADQAAIAITNSNLLTRLRESETRYRTLASSSPDLVFETDADGRWTFLSDRARTMLGWDIDETVGKHYGETVADGWRERADQQFAEFVSDPTSVYTARLDFAGGDGTPVPVEINVIGTLEDGRLSAIHGVARDISERERLEHELQASEARFRNLVQTTPDVIYRCDSEGRFLFMAEGSEALFGWTPAEVADLTFADLTAEESLPEALANFAEQRREHDVVRRYHYMLRHRDGTTFPGEISSVSVWEDGRFAGVQGTVRDITTQERLERELHESQERYRFLVDNAPDVVFSTDAEGNFTFMSDAMERISGWKPEEVIGGHFSRVVDPSTFPTAMSRWQALVDDPATEQVSILRLRGPDGRLTPVEVSAIGMVDDEGRFAGIHGATRDISERDRLERELRESEERYRYLVASSPDLVWLTDAAGTLTFLSDAARGMLGIEPTDLIGHPYADIFAPSARRDATIRFRWLARHPTAVHRMRLPFRHADGHDVVVEINGTGMTADGVFIGAHGAARDVSERDRLERDLRRQAGELAAGEERAHLARELHDSVTQALFSMTLVSRSVEMLLDRDPDAARTQLAQLRDLQREALAEMRALIFELRPGNLEQDGLARALRTHTAALQGRIGLPIMVESTLDERLPLPVEEVLYRISQEALHNVVKHAAARQVRLELGRIASGIRLRISDDGKGFDPDRVPDGHLGLAGMRARADRIGGRLSVRSVPGEGTTIEVVVPNAAIAAQGATPDAPDVVSIRDG